METFIGFLIFMYIILIPYLIYLNWESINKIPYIRWYFIKSKRINWLGFILFIIVGSGSFIWVLFYYILLLIGYIIKYLVLIPFFWLCLFLVGLFEFLFMNKEEDETK